MAWLMVMIVGFPIVFYLPSHWIFASFFPRPASIDTVLAASTFPPREAAQD